MAAGQTGGFILEPVDWADTCRFVSTIRRGHADPPWVRQMLWIGAMVDSPRPGRAQDTQANPVALWGRRMRAASDGYLRGFLELGDERGLDRTLTTANFLDVGGRWLSLALAAFGGDEVDSATPPPYTPGPYLSPIEPRGIAEAAVWFGLLTDQPWPLATLAGSELAGLAVRQAKVWIGIMALGASGQQLVEEDGLASRLFAELHYGACRCGSHRSGCTGIRSQGAVGSSCGTHCCQPAHRLASWKPEDWGSENTLRYFVTEALTGFINLDALGVGLPTTDRQLSAGELPTVLQKVGNFGSSMLFAAIRADRPIDRDERTDFASDGFVLGDVLRRSCTACGKKWDPVSITPVNAAPIDVNEEAEAEYARYIDPTHRRADGNRQVICPHCGTPWASLWTVAPRQLISAPDHRLATAWSCQGDGCTAVVLGDPTIPPPDHGHDGPSRGWAPVVAYVRLGIGEELLPRGSGLLGRLGLEGEDPEFLALLWRLRAYMKLLRYLQLSPPAIYEMVARIFWLWLQWAFHGYEQGSLFENEIYEKMLRICASDFQIMFETTNPPGHSAEYPCWYDGPLALLTCDCSQPVPPDHSVRSHYGAVALAKEIMRENGGLANVSSMVWLPDGDGAGLIEEIVTSLRTLAPMK